MILLKKFVLLLFIVMPVLVFSQSPDDEMDPENINEKYLEHLIKKKVHSVRQSKGLVELVNDSILYVASLHHSSVMGAARSVGHYESQRKFRTPQKRAETFGAVNYFTGENVASFFSCKKFNLRRPELNEYFTYGEFATKIVRAWVKSRGHYRNIIRKDYQVTGLSTYYDKKRKRMYVTQKFADVKSKFVFTENTNLFPYEDYNEVTYELNELKQVARRMHRGPHRWHLKPRKNFRRCRQCDAVAYQKNNFRFYVDSSDNIHCVQKNGRLFKRLTRRWRDGLAVEIVHYKDYECGNTNFFLTPSRRNGQCIANGIIQKPVYQWKLRKTYRWERYHWKRKKWKTIRNILLSFQFKKYSAAFKSMVTWFPGCPSDNIIGKFPANDSDYFECNILFLKKKRVCTILQFTDYCGQDFSEIKPTPLLPELSATEYRYPEDTLRYDFTIHFKQGKSMYDYSDIKPLLDTLKLQNYSIVRLQINATASVEGDEAINNRLILARSLSIRRVLDSTRVDTLVKDIEAKEDWDHFYKNLAKINYQHFRKLSREQVKKELSDPTVAKALEPILEQERKASIKLWLMEKSIDSVKVKHARRRFKELVDSAAILKPSSRLANKMLTIQTLLYTHVRQGKLPASQLTEVIPPYDPAYAKVYLNYVIFKRTLDTVSPGDYSDRDLYDALYKVALKPLASAVQRYNFLSLLVNHWDSTAYYDTEKDVQPKRMFALLGRLNTTAIPKDTLEQLKLNFYFKAARWFSVTDPDENSQLRAMNNIYYSYRRRTYNDSLAYRLARYFIFYNRDNFAYQILAPFALRKNPDHAVFALYLKMAYSRDLYRKRSRFYRLIKVEPSVLSREEYCNLFTGPCNISMEIFENEEIRRTWCKTCNGYENYAEFYRAKMRTNISGQ